MNHNLQILRAILLEIAAQQPGESREEAITRAAGIAGVSYRVAKAVLYNEDRRYVTCDDERLQRAQAGLVRFLADEEARLQAALLRVQHRRRQVDVIRDPLPAVEQAA